MGGVSGVITLAPGVLSVVGIVGTLHAVATDEYHRLPLS